MTNRLCEQGLTEALGTGSARPFMEKACHKTRETRDPAWLYHEASTLEPDTLDDETHYPGPSGEFYKTYPQAPRLRLPPPMEESGVDVLSAIRSRRSRREYSSRPLSLGEVSTLLYHVAGVTGRAWWGGPKRAYPSSGALQPVEVYLLARRVEGLEPGLYHYNPGGHELEMLNGDVDRLGRELYHASLEQDHVASAPLVLLLTVVYPRTARKYGWRAYRYVHWDVGFAGQNVYLACEALGLGTVAVGAFRDEQVCRVLGIDCFTEFPMLLFPVGQRV